MDGVKPYLEYRASGVPALGAVPAHWAVQRQRSVAQLLVSNIDKHTHDDETPVRLCNYVDVYKHDRITESIAFMPATASREEVERFRLRQGDVIITKDSESWTDIGVPAIVEYTAPDLVCGYHLAILRPRENVLNGEYLLRALQSQGVAVQFHVAANGVTRYGLSHEAIKSIWLPTPPLSEQVAIARFLDHLDRRVRRYISAKRRLLVLLNEQKRAIINQAVKRGLDANVPMKPSGEEWLGNVPDHWRVVRLKWVARLQRGYDLPQESRKPGSVPVISSGGTIDTHSEARAVGPGVVIGRYGSTDAVFFVEEDYWPHNTALFVTDFQDNDPRWCYYLLRAITKTSYSAKSAVPGVDRKDLYEILVPCPPVDEQLAIVCTLELSLKNLDLRVNAVERQIQAIREYQSSLIASVVTGKLDVREAARQLTDELPQADPVDDIEVQSGEEAEVELPYDNEDDEQL